MRLGGMNRREKDYSGVTRNATFALVFLANLAACFSNLMPLSVLFLDDFYFFAVFLKYF